MRRSRHSCNTVRARDKATRTALCEVNPADGTLTELTAFESGGDTSYAGVVTEGNVLWASYYSSHEGKASIYFVKVFLNASGAGATPPLPSGFPFPVGGSRR